MKSVAVGPIVRRIWEEELAVRLLYHGVRTVQVYSILPISKPRTNAIGKELDEAMQTRTVRCGRGPGITDLSDSYMGCCQVSLVVGCFKLAQDMLRERGGPLDQHLGEWVVRTIQLYRADIRLRRKFAGDQVFEVCRAYHENQVEEGFCPYCDVPYAMSYSTARQLKCPFCALPNDRTDVAIIKELTQKVYLRIGSRESSFDP